MALIIPGMMSAISGKVGGVEFAGHKGRSMLKRGRTRKPKVSKWTHRAQKNHNIMVNKWKELTDNQQRAWEVAAMDQIKKDRLGQARTMSGFEFFMSMPHDFDSCAVAAYQTDPPLGHTIWPATTEITLLSPEIFYVTATNWRYGTDHYLMVALGRFKHKLGTYKNFRWINLPMIEADSDTVSMAGAMAERNVEFIVGEIVMIKVRLWTSGKMPIMVYHAAHTVEAAP